MNAGTGHHGSSCRHSPPSALKNARRWQRLFGHDFALSQRMAEVVWKYPIILDAVASEMQRKGDSMMAKCAPLMCCFILRPAVVQPGIVTCRNALPFVMPNGSGT
eukprot:1159951-Pelagomonas_calceolata.AAC.3